MTNKEIGRQFTLLSRLLDIHGANSFRVKSYASLAYTIEKLPESIADMDPGRIASLRGVGEASAAKIIELLQTGRLESLEELVLQTPPGVIEMMQIKGLGPKKIAVIWKEMGIESPGELEYACNENRLAMQKGFGQKTQERVLQEIAYIRQNQGWFLWSQASAFAEDLIGKIREQFPERRVETTGSLRRKTETVRYAELLTDIDGGVLEEFLRSIQGAVSIEGDRDTRAFLSCTFGEGPECHIYSTAPADFERSLFLTTGSGEFVASFIAQYGVPAEGGPISEESVFSAHGLYFIEPEQRELPLSAHAIQEPPVHLIRTEDIKGIIHAHSTWSDGMHTLEEMAGEALRMGFEYLVISDHSRSAWYANGLQPERVAAQHEAINTLNEKLKPFRIFKGIEADILNDGSLDYEDNLLDTFDVVIASVHSNLSMSGEKAMERLLTAVRNPYTTILGHPTGRLLLSREGYPVDHKILIDACSEHGVVIEINAHPRRLDLDWRWVSYALEKGVLLSVNPDAHAVSGFRDVHYGVQAARKGGLSAEFNLSSFSLEAFEAFLENRRQQRSR